MGQTVVCGVGVPTSLVHELVISFDPGIGFRVGLSAHRRRGDDEVFRYLDSKMLQDGLDCLLVGVDELFIHHSKRADPSLTKELVDSRFVVFEHTVDLGYPIKVKCWRLGGPVRLSCTSSPRS